MAAPVASLLLSIVSGIATALVLAVGREVRRVSKTVSESAAAAATLTATVARLQAHDAENRERIAVLWAHVFPANPAPPWRSSEPAQPQRARAY